MIKIIREIAPKDKQFYFAVSMGVDSVSAYFWMREKGYNVIPLHFNHKLRVQNDLMESKFVELCKATNVEPIVGNGKDLVSEKDCRHARINFYKQTVEFGSTVLTAHHINDFVESYLLNCFRGHPNHNAFELISGFNHFQIAHPFLLSKKNDFIQYAERNNLTRFVVQDETNSETKGSRRNWIRNTIIPEMKNQKISLERYAERKIQGLINENFVVE